MTISHGFEEFGEGQDKSAQARELRRGRAIEQRFARVGKSIETFWGPIVVWDWLLGVSMIFVQYAAVGPGFPGGVVTAFLIMVTGLLRRPTVRVRWGGIMVAIMVLLILFLALESRFNSMPWIQRDGKFFLLLASATMIGAGRINIRSFLVGGVVGVLINVPLYYAGLTPDEYHPYLTGFFGDKNVAGMYYALWGILALLVLPRRWHKWWILLSFGLLFLTGSRTSMAAYGLALGWVFVRGRFGLTMRLVIAGIGWWVLWYFENNLAQAKVFGDRKGDDWFRQQIEAAMSAKADITPWYGMGLNQGKVLLGGTREAWFHDSYLQAFVEGGYPFLITIIVAFVFIGMGALDRRIVLPRALVCLEGGVIVILVCAWKLGEVFMTLGAFMVLGLCMAYRLGEPIVRETDVYGFATRGEERRLARLKLGDGRVTDA